MKGETIMETPNIDDLYRQLDAIKAQIEEAKHSRVYDMVGRYGECVNKARAAEILNCSTSRITTMVRDGRLRTVCEGKRIDVRSIAEYLEAPQQIDFQTRFRKKHGDQRFYV